MVRVSCKPSEKVGEKRYIAVERGITSNSTVRCLHSIQKQRGLPAMKCLMLMVCEKYPLRYFYQSEEPGMCEYWTNDDEGTNTF